MRKVFKLRSGNTTPFKQMGEHEETTEQYNDRSRAEYEARLQANSDSTDAYNQAVIIDNLYNKGQDIKNEATKEVLGKFKELKKQKEYYKQHRIIGSESAEAYVVPDPGFNYPGCGTGYKAE